MDAKRAKKIHETLDFIFIAVPVFGREEPESEIGEAEMRKMMDEFRTSMGNSISMSGDRGQILRSSPAAIAVANNGEVVKIIGERHG